MSSTFYSSMVGLRVLYKPRPKNQANPTIPTTTNIAALTIPAIVACLCCVTFVDGFRQQHCQTCYEDIILFNWKEIIRGIWLFWGLRGSEVTLLES
jgi:hypothetical protein